MQSPNICSQNQWICQQQLSFWRKLLISFLSWGANSTMFVKELRAQLHNGALKPHSRTRACGLKNVFFKLSKDCRLETPGDRFTVKIFLAIVDTRLMHAVANALRISAEHNWSVFMFVSGAANDSIWFWFARQSYKTDKYSYDVSSDLNRQLLAFSACAGAFIQKAKDPQDVLNVIMSLEMSLCFPDVVTAYTIFLTLPVSVAATNAASHSSSCWRHICGQLRLTSHDRLSDLGILSIERDRFSEVNKRKILEMFAQRKAWLVRKLKPTYFSETMWV